LSFKACEEFNVWDLSSEVYIENVSISSSRAVEMILVAISPLILVSSTYMKVKNVIEYTYLQLEDVLYDAVVDMPY
jgi:hypothetical protein